jgi:hypothetical protein
MPKKAKAYTKKRRAKASKKGWETRRKNNPLKWGKTAVAKHKQQKRAEDYIKKRIDVELEVEELEKKLEEAKARRKITELYGEEKPAAWKQTLFRNMQEFVFARDSNELTHKELMAIWRKWHSAKVRAKKKHGLREVKDLVAIFGSAIGLPSTGNFSVMRFVTS